MHLKKISIYKNELFLKINEKKAELEEEFFKDPTNVSMLNSIKIDIDFSTISHDNDIGSVVNFNKNEKTHL